MSAIKHDSDGFLQGDPIQIGQRDGNGDALNLWQGIKADTAAIRAAVIGIANGRNFRATGSGQLRKVDEAANSPRYSRSYVPRTRDASGRFVATPPTSGARQVATLTAAVAKAAKATGIPAVKATVAAATAGTAGSGAAATQGDAANRRAATHQPTAMRDARGRFHAAGGNGSGTERGSRSGAGIAAKFGDSVDRFGQDVAGIGDAMDGVDPAVAASKEVASIVSPVMKPVAAGLRGALRLFGRNKDDDQAIPWYRRIWQELHDMNGRDNGGAAGGSGGLLGGLGKLGSMALSPLRGLGKLLGGGGAGLGRMARMGKFLGRGGILAGVLGVGKMLWDENDKSLTREQKNRAHIQTGAATVGSIAGGAIGSLLGPLGTLGGAALGGYIGDAVGAKMADVDWKGVGDKMVAKWDATTDWFEKAWGPALAAFADKAKKLATNTKEVVVQTAAKAKEVAVQAAKKTNAVVKNTTGVDPAAVAKNAASGAGAALAGGWHWIEDKLSTKNAVTRRALKTGADYKAGNIGNLNDAQTRALVASTAETESAGGKLDIRNLGGKGYVGRYQAGAAWLADAGLINGGSAAVKSAMKADGHTSEWKWAQSGGMDRFLRNNSNWKNGLSLQQYMGSAELQDAAFKTNSDKAYQQLLTKGLITKDTAPEVVAGLLKSRHLAGMGGAAAVARGGTGAVDANGTSARKYYQDVALDARGYHKAYSALPAVATAKPAAPAAPRVAAATPPAVASSAMPPARQPVSAAMAPVSVPSAPPSRTLIGSNGKPQQTVVVVPQQDIGQNVGDRTIAHLATGGLGSQGRG